MTKLNILLYLVTDTDPFQMYAHKPLCRAVFWCSVTTRRSDARVPTHTLEMPRALHHHAPLHPCRTCTTPAVAGGQHSAPHDKCFLRHSLAQRTRAGLDTRREDFLSKQLSRLLPDFHPISGPWAPEQLLTSILDDSGTAFTLLAP